MIFPGTKTALLLPDRTNSARQARSKNARVEAGLKRADVWYNPENPAHLSIIEGMKSDEREHMRRWREEMK